MVKLLALILFPAFCFSQVVRTPDGYKKLVAGSNVTVTESASSVTIAASGGEGGGTPRFSLAAHWSQSMTKTNIGANFVNIYSQTNADGKSVTIDTNGKDSVMLTVTWNKVGTGTQTVEIHDGANVLISMNVVSGFNTVTVAIPAEFQDRVANVRPRAKSTVAGDDPIAEGVGVYLK